MDSGNCVSLFEERSIKVSFVNCWKVEGNSVSKLLSDYSFYRRVRFPKS